jgi:hypothetical protein
LSGCCAVGEDPAVCAWAEHPLGFCSKRSFAIIAESVWPETS